MGFKVVMATAMLAAVAVPAAACDMHGGFGGYFDGYRPAAYSEPRDPANWESNADLTQARAAFVQRFNIKSAPPASEAERASGRDGAAVRTADAN